MSLNVEIRVDAPQALSTSNAVEASLAKVEARGPSIGAALAKGFGNGSSAAEKAKQSTTSLTDQMSKLANTSSAFTGFADVFKREADMLERIKGPAREYAADLRTLDMLLQKDAISTKEYADQVTNLNRRMGERPSAPPTSPGAAHGGGEGEGGGVKIEGSVASAAAGQFGELGTTLEGLASKGAIEAAAMAALATEAIHLGDEYVELSNKALKLADSTHSVDEVLNEQFELSKELHGSLEQTMELTTIVKERTEDLAVSQSTLNAFTKELAAGVELSGKSMGDAAGLVNRLSFALESGLPAGREMKNLMREYPAVAKDMEVATGLTAKQLVEMANKGQLSMETLVTSISGSSAAFTALGQRTETMGQQWQHFKDELVLTAGKLVEQSGLLKVVGAVFQVLGDIVTFVTSVLSGIQSVLGSTGTAFVALGAAIALGLGPITAIVAAFELAKKAGEALADVFMADVEAHIKLLDAEIAALEVYNKEMEAVNAQYDAIIKDVQAHNDLFDAVNRVATAMAAGNKIYDDANAKAVEAQKKVDAYAGALEHVKDLLSKMPQGGDMRKFLTQSDVDIVRGYQDAQRDLNDSMTVGGSVLNEIHKKEDERRRGLEDLNFLLKSHKISQLEYNEAIKQYTERAAAISDDEKMYDKIISGQVEASKGLAEISRLLGEGRITAQQFEDEYTKLLALIGKTPPGIVDKLNFHIAAPDFSSVPLPDKALSENALDILKQTASATDKYHDELQKLNAAQGELAPAVYSHALEDLNAKFGASVSPAEKLNKEVEDLNGLFGAGALSFADYEKKLQDIGKEQEKLADSGKDFGSGISRGLHSIRDEATDVASTIASSMKSAFDEINSDIIDTVTKGSADWGKLASDIEADFAKIALQSLEAGAVSGLTKHATDTAGAAATGVATGTSASATMLTAAPGIGLAIGSAAAAAIAAGAAAAGAEQGGASAAAAAIAGSWAGSDTMIHAANGYAGRVRGVAGTDTKLFAAMVTPGESVAIRTPAQMAAEQRGSGGQRGPTIINKYDTRGELAAGFAAGEHDVAIVNLLRRNKGALQSLLKK